ncbi:MAG: hypothetical protein LBC86_10660 [Oscillospiraceae bacterium]|jgi:hypothetical protein|nr:hypothetical protein [Oscillospiraceae bacterium]
MIEEKLLNKELIGLSRAACTLMLSIGDIITIEKIKGGTYEGSEYAMHISSMWRFTKNGDILLATHDITTPFDENLENDDDWDWDYDILGREKEKGSIFDVRQLEFINDYLPLKIKNVKFTDTNDLHIEFDKDICLDTFISCSRKQEYLRFIDFNTRKHTVIFEKEHQT